MSPRVVAPLSLLVVLAAAGCGSTSTTPPPVVPWKDSPIALYVAPLPKPHGYPTSAPPCRGDQVRVTQGGQGVGLGKRLEVLHFTNTSPAPCLLRGYPSITGVTEDGTRRRLPARQGGTYFGRLVPADLAPGGRVSIDFGTSNAGCGNNPSAPGTTFRQLVFRLPSGGVVHAGPRVRITEVCSIDMTTFGLPVNDGARPGTLGALQAQMRLPAKIARGAPLHFTVTLVNHGRTRIALDPCPGFSEGFYEERRAVKRSFRLNCGTARAIDAHARVRYAMELPVPRRTRPGIAKVGWSLDTPYGPYAPAGTVRVTG